jgi:hypothetical protein
MSLTIVPVYAAMLSLLFIFLSARVIRARRQERVALGDGGNETLIRTMGVQSNFAEYVPLTILLMAFVELRGLPAWPIHLLGITLLVGRCLHAYGVSQPRENYNYRVAGMAMTFGVIGVAALLILGDAIV